MCVKAFKLVFSSIFPLILHFFLSDRGEGLCTALNLLPKRSWRLILKHSCLSISLHPQTTETVAAASLVLLVLFIKECEPCKCSGLQCFISPRIPEVKWGMGLWASDVVSCSLSLLFLPFSLPCWAEKPRIQPRTHQEPVCFPWCLPSRGLHPY